MPPHERRGTDNRETRQDRWKPAIQLDEEPTIVVREPDRQMRQRAIGLTDGQSDFVTTAIATGYDDRLPVTGMKSVTDNRLTQLIVSIMKLSRLRLARS